LKVHRIQSELLTNEAADATRLMLYSADQNTAENCRSSTYTEDFVLTDH
jgi:hypothetical protein